MGDLQTWLIILVIIIVTILLRFIPFIIFNNDKKIPKIIKKLSSSLPYAIMSMLVVYCLKDISITNVDSIIPILISCLIVGCLYVWKRNTLISIVIGTICYMILIQFVF